MEKVLNRPCGIVREIHGTVSGTLKTAAVPSLGTPAMMR